MYIASSVRMPTKLGEPTNSTVPSTGSIPGTLSRSFARCGHAPQLPRAPVGAGRLLASRSSQTPLRSGEPHTASTADNRRRSAHANTAQPANQGQHRMRGPGEAEQCPRPRPTQTARMTPTQSVQPADQDQPPHARHPREAEQIRKPDRTAARVAPRLRASRYEKLAVRATSPPSTSPPSTNRYPGTYETRAGAASDHVRPRAGPGCSNSRDCHG